VRLRHVTPRARLPAPQTAEREAELWGPHLPLVVPGMLALGRGACGDEGVRRLAVEFVATLVDIKPAMMQVAGGVGVCACVSDPLHDCGPPPRGAATAAPGHRRSLLYASAPARPQSVLGGPALSAQLLSCLAALMAAGTEDDPQWGAQPMASPDIDEDDSLGAR
jgi:hypothetical protein